jgi:hypothetical protein
MGKSDKKPRKPKKDHSTLYAEDTHEEKGFSNDESPSGEQEEQTHSDDSERPGFSQWVDEDDDEANEPPAVGFHV